MIFLFFLLFKEKYSLYYILEVDAYIKFISFVHLLEISHKLSLWHPRLLPTVHRFLKFIVLALWIPYSFRSSNGRNAKCELQLKNCSRTWILHWGCTYHGNGKCQNGEPYHDLIFLLHSLFVCMNLWRQNLINKLLCRHNL